MSNRSYKKSGGRFSSFASALIGAIIGGFVVYFLLVAPQSNKKEISENKTQVETRQDNTKPIDIKENESMESVVVKKSIDSVVGINTVSKVTRQSFFGPQSGYVEGIGSGSIVSEDGYIVTNSHVVSDGEAKEINVLFNNGETAPAELVWNDASLDLAIIKVASDNKNLKAIDIGDSDEIGVGDRVVAIGNPLGFNLQSTVTSGIISGLNRSVSFNTGVQMDGLMQTDAAINSGNSGGALLNSRGQLIGINTAKAGNSDGIGFAIPINTVKPVIDKIRENGKFDSVYLGITGQSLDYLRKLQYLKDDIKAKSGIYVVSVFTDDSTIKEGDVIKEIDGKPVKDMAALKKLLLAYNIGDTVKLTIERDGEEKEVDFEFTVDSSNVDEYKSARPNETKEKQEEKSNPFFNLP
ncbi:S1C family serine protease [Anaerococcus degeneri]|uniref:Trypsin-like peptidase domain-containing protein n=1 Tax=Anaerococcus degeneri TaxID=361500 RepID=A0ABS7YVT2_9FIRM|nr:trypsin-like peptidase domain-containing protein [Anaerococcus degeneri]MBP2016032.1 S1-C subfamily serine protease [Anaerococcus degeneri]MCA2095778.1 trypsin-like peptidase domain-containing protein [Anaerococcus degeneri]